MALQFPSSPTNGQTYQSGSSPIYTYNGVVWELSSANTGIANLNAYTASLKTALNLTGSNATILGNLNVQGTQTALNQASLQITDKFIRVASGSISSATSDGAGIRIDGANVTMSWDSSNSRLAFNTQISASKYYGDGSGLTGISSYTNSDNLAYLNTKGVISGSSQVVGILSSLNTYTASNDTTNTTQTNRLTAIESVTSSYETKGRGIVSGSSQLTSSFDVRYATSASYVTSLNGLISGSSQLTSSYDTRYTLSGSVGATPAGTISGSSQLTASFDTRYLTIGGDGVISGSSQLTSSYDTRYTLSGSVVSGTTPAGTISGSSQLTSSFDGRYLQTASFNSFTASAQTVTTGSNSFNGTQTITGSLIVSTGSFIGSLITANTSSLYLTSGSNLYVQNNGLVQISGSLTVSGSSNTSIISPALIIGTGSGDEGGEIQLAKAITNTTLTGSGVTIDVYRDKVRIFEQGGAARGAYIDLTSTAAGVGTNLQNVTYFLEVNASVTYSLPGSYTADTCRYSVINTSTNGTSAWFNTSSYTFTPLKAGYWEINANYDIYRGSSTAEASLTITKNGTNAAVIGGLGMISGNISKIVYLNGSTDSVQIVNAGSAISSRSQDATKSWFQAKLIGE